MIASAAGCNVGSKRFGSYDTLDADVRLSAERVRDFLGDVDASVDAPTAYIRARKRLAATLRPPVRRPGIRRRGES